MSDNSVPLAQQQLEQVVEVVARGLLEKWAIDDRFTEEQLLEYAQYSVDDTVFVINEYMSLINSLLVNQASQAGIDI
jgi:hypothetical protein